MSGIASTFITGIIGLAVLAVLVGSKSNTSNVISSLSTGFSNVIGAAVKPVS